MAQEEPLGIVARRIAIFNCNIETYDDVKKALKRVFRKGWTVCVHLSFGVGGSFRIMSILAYPTGKAKMLKHYNADPSKYDVCFNIDE